MYLRQRAIFILSFILSLGILLAPYTRRAYAEMISTNEAVSDLMRVQKRERVVSFLKRNQIEKELVKFGVSEKEANLRIASLSDDEIQKMATQIDRVPAGGDVIVISLTTVLLIILILLLLRKI